MNSLKIVTASQDHITIKNKNWKHSVLKCIVTVFQ
jgi:hypothetical protein